MMTRGKRWWERRRHDAGASAGVGVIGGLILFVTVFTAGIGVFQAARIHHALYQAAQKASQVEQQQGCWTNGASTAVYNTLKANGLNPNTVKVTADTASTQDYGQGVTAGLKTHVGIHVLGLNLATVPIGATANGASFYTPSVPGGTNPACAAVNICPIVTTSTPQCTPAHQVCQTVSHQQCTPTTKNVCHQVATQHCTPVTTQQCGYTPQSVYSCHSVTTQQCGYTTQEVYACHPVTSCHPVTTRHCTTIPPSCHWVHAAGRWIRECSPSRTSCYDTTTTVCSTTDQCGYTPESVYSCHPVTTQQCGYTTQDVYSCHSVTTQSCQTVDTTQCHSVTSQSCHTVQSQSCTTDPQQCTTVTQQVNQCTGAVLSSTQGSGGSSSTSATSGSSSSSAITVTHITASGSTVTVTGANLPVLSQASSAYGGENYGNFLWSQGSTPTTQASADGNATYPFHPDWGIKVLSSSSTELIFTPANTPTGTWYLYLVARGHGINAQTVAVGHG